MRTPLIYALHSGNLYGTEQMALATAQGLRDEYAPVIFAPEGKALAEARRLGLETRSFQSPWEFVQRLRPYLAAHGELAFMATGLAHSLALALLNLYYRRRVVHLHIVHGGADERLSYGRKRLLNHLGVTFVAVSGFVKERLVANGVCPERIAVVENFLPPERVESAPRRPPFDRPGIRRAIVVSRVDPIKRIDLLLEALDYNYQLRGLSVRVLGSGWDLEKLSRRARGEHPNVAFAGYSPNVGEELAKSDLLLHLCPVEPFGLAVIEAMAAGVPVLVPDSGGAGTLVEDEVSGFRFRADDADHLATRLLELTNASAERLNRVVEGGLRALATRFEASARLDDYRRLLAAGLAEPDVAGREALYER